MTAATSITVRVPMTIRRRGGRKLVAAPDGSPAWAPQRARPDSTLIKALARAHPPHQIEARSMPQRTTAGSWPRMA
jgi:hypothetical protein